MRKKTPNREDTIMTTRQRNYTANMLFFLQSEFFHQQLIKLGCFTHVVSDIEEKYQPPDYELMHPSSVSHLPLYSRPSVNPLLVIIIFQY